MSNSNYYTILVSTVITMIWAGAISGLILYRRLEGMAGGALFSLFLTPAALAGVRCWASDAWKNWAGAAFLSVAALWLAPLMILMIREPGGDGIGAPFLWCGIPSAVAGYICLRKLIKRFPSEIDDRQPPTQESDITSPEP